jgi:FkbM family methyltransferase
MLSTRQKGILISCFFLSCVLIVAFSVQKIIFPAKDNRVGEEISKKFMDNPGGEEISKRVMAIVESRIATSQEIGSSQVMITDTRQTEAKRCDRNDIKNLMVKHSQSQQGEDAYLVQHFFKGLCGGIYVELGALDGVTYSNTHFFRHALAWKGALIEPNTKSFKKLKKNRAPRDDVFNAAVCANKQMVHFLEDGGNGAISGVVEFMAPTFVRRWHTKTNPKATLTKIMCESLSGILMQSNVVGSVHVDFLSVDVEGGEFEVIKTLDFNKHQFGVILYEADEHNPVKNEALKSFLVSNGYPFFGHYQHSNYHVNKNWGEIYSNVLA